VVDYVGDKLAEELTLAEMAGAAHISPYHFSRLFKESTVRTPHRYIIERRVQRAKELYPPTPGKYPRILNKEAEHEVWSIELRGRDTGDAPSSHSVQFGTHPVVERPTAYLACEIARC
jgi:hypothetical protein